jgi:hypothetical protein
MGSIATAYRRRDSGRLSTSEQAGFSYFIGGGDPVVDEFHATRQENPRASPSKVDSAVAALGRALSGSFSFFLKS